jgi:hypothetical protein
MKTACYCCGHDAYEIRACGDRREYACPRCLANGCPPCRGEGFIMRDGDPTTLYACLASDLEGILKPMSSMRCVEPRSPMP